jgi:hypothetical protein
MNQRDYIGKRGEAIFRFLITDWCDGEPWFDDNFLGEKQPVTDFIVHLIEPTTGGAVFYAQVKATNGKYVGTGRTRRLKVKLSARDTAGLKQAPGPAFLVGIDITTRRGYFVQLTARSPKSYSSLPLRHRLNCRNLKKIWQQVDAYWGARSMLPAGSEFDARG